MVGGIGDIHSDVKGFNDTSKGVNGDEKEGVIGFLQCIVKPQHGAEKCYLIRY